jgi:hypothetical protein
MWQEFSPFFLELTAFYKYRNFMSSFNFPLKIQNILKICQIHREKYHSLSLLPKPCRLLIRQRASASGLHSSFLTSSTYIGKLIDRSSCCVDSGWGVGRGEVVKSCSTWVNPSLYPAQKGAQIRRKQLNWRWNSGIGDWLEWDICEDSLKRRWKK